MPLTARPNPLALLLLVLGATLTLCAWLAGGPSEILGTLPALLLVAALAFRRYPGERLIECLARRFARPPRPVSAAVPALHLGPLLGPTLAFLATARPLRGPPALPSS